MNRRAVIKNLALVVGGAVLLPSCLRKDGTSYVQLKHINLDGDQQQLIADVAETIIPKTTTPGAKDLKLPAFVLLMIDDCLGKKDQEAFVKGLAAFNDKVKAKYNKDFADLDPKEREAFITDIENANKPKKGAAPTRRFKPKKSDAADPLLTFYYTVRQQTIFGYTTSQYFMTKLVFYDMIPGRYNVHYPVSKLKLA